MANDLGFPPISDGAITSGASFYFISYNTEDKTRIMPLVQNLHAHGVPLWYDKGIEYGEYWEHTIGEKLRQCKAVLFFLTAGILKKKGPNGSDPYTMKEFRIAKKLRKTIYIIRMDVLENYQEIPDEKLAFMDEVDILQTFPVYKQPENLDWATREICEAIGIEWKRGIENLHGPRTRIKKTLSMTPYSSFEITGNILKKFIGKESFVRIPDGISIIGEHAFSNCSSLQEIIFPDSVTYIEQFAFSKCYQLKVVNMSNHVIGIGNCAFMECMDLNYLKIPNSVTGIGCGAFAFSGLQNLIIPYGITHIHDTTFYNCRLNNITIPDSVKYIGACTFQNIKTIKDVYYTGTKKQWEALHVQLNSDVRIHFRRSRIFWHLMQNL